MNIKQRQRSLEPLGKTSKTVLILFSFLTANAVQRVVPTQVKPKQQVNLNA